MAKVKNFNGKTMHVLYTGLVFSEVITGGDQLFLDIAPRLPKELRIIVVTPHFVKKHWDKIDQTNIEFRILPPNRFEFKGNPFYIFFSYVIRSWQVYKVLRKEDVQTIYSSSDIAYADVWPAFFAVGRKTKIRWITRIYHVLLSPKSRQGSYIVNVVAFRLQRLSFWMMKKRSSTILALNPRLYEEVLELGFPKNKLAVLGAGIDFSKINSYKPTKKYPYDVVVLGRRAPVKGIFDTIKIWNIVHDKFPDARLAWIGGGGENYMKKIREQIKEGSIQDSFHLMGFLDKDMVYDILKSAKVFLCPDHENGWGLAVSEAMSIGLPVVSYDLDIFGGVYKKGYLSAPLYNTEEFAENLMKMLSNDKLRKQIATEAIEQAREFDHQTVINELIKHI